MALSRLFRREKSTPVAAARVPEGQRVYAIGDIHGRDDLFERLIAKIDADDAARSPAQTTLILLGDLVDRGPASRAVVDRAIALRAAGGERFRYIIGNHEEVFLKALRGDPQVVRYFVRIGGEPTILSYVADHAAYRAMDFDELAVALPQAVPTEHVSFLDDGEDQIRIGDYLFVHAGIRPGVPLVSQQPGDLRWIRDSFLDDERDHGCVVIHGHTITDAPDVCGNRIGIDTGAYASGVLTAIGLEGAERWFITS